MDQVLRFGLVFLFIGLEFLRRGSQAKTLEPTANDKHSTILIGIAFSLAIVVSPLLDILGIGYVYSIVFFWIGVTFAGVGILIRFWAMKSLGEFYTRTLVVTKEHTLIDFGPYAFVRHPGYFGSILFWFGITFSTYNLLSTAIVLILVVAAYLYRVQTEESMLLDAFGKAYKAYIKKNKVLDSFFLLNLHDILSIWENSLF